MAGSRLDRPLPDSPPTFDIDDPCGDGGAGIRAQSAVLDKLRRLRPQPMAVLLKTAAAAATCNRLKNIQSDQAVGRQAQAALRAVEALRERREIVAAGQRGERVVYTTAAKAAATRFPPFGR